MRVHILQHVEFEDAGHIQTWAQSNNVQISTTRLYASEQLAAIDDFDLLVIMGGPMSVNDQSRYDWLVKEKRYIEKVIGADKKVLGVCLGAQLIADVLGAKVYKSRCKEIGWFDVEKNAESKGGWFDTLPDKFCAFHWHGETFDIPKNAVRLAVSRCCENQAFSYGTNVLGLQFHLESTKKSVAKLVENCGDELNDGGKFVQSKDQIAAKSKNTTEVNKLAERLLDEFVFKR